MLPGRVARQANVTSRTALQSWIIEWSLAGNEAGFNRRHVLGCHSPALMSDAFKRFAFVERGAFGAAFVGIDETHVVESQQPQDGRVQVVNVQTIFDGSQTEFVRRANRLAAANSAAGEPHAEARRVVIATVAFLAQRKIAFLARAGSIGIFGASGEETRAARAS